MCWFPKPQVAGSNPAGGIEFEQQVGSACTLGCTEIRKIDPHLARIVVLILARITQTPAISSRCAELKPEAQAKESYYDPFACASGLYEHLNNPD